MATEFCRKCKEQHPGRECDYKDGECEELRPLTEEEQKAVADFQQEMETKVIPEIVEADRRRRGGSTVHAPGCDCGFCKAGFTKY